MNLIHFGIILSVVVLVRASPAEQCDGENFEGLRDRITVLPCGKTKCKLPKEQNITVIFKFNPKTKMTNVRNKVNAVIGGIPLPFIGVDGTSACTNIFHADGSTPAPCPLEANKEYVYTNAFYVEPIFPEVPLTVVWSLDDGKTNAICFKIRAAIIKKKKA